MNGMLAPMQTLDKSWSQQLAEARRPDKIAESLGWPQALVDRLSQDFGFSARATRYYLELVDTNNPNDPVLRQILPHSDEARPTPEGFRLDAVGDTHQANAPAPGVVHKYSERGLLITTGACAVNCRFCFRRNYPYSEINQGGAALEEAFEYIASDPTIHEVILSGGDPLSLPNSALQRLFARMGTIPHIRRVRIHSRMPVVLPDRIDEEFLALLDRAKPLRIWFVTHFNCAEELTARALAACQRLLDKGVPVLNQSVLLRGVNDSVEAQKQLLHGLVDAGVKPYYLHQLDRVSGTAHFEVDETRGATIVRELRDQVSGIAMPDWVRDDPGKRSKTPLLS